MGCGDCENLSRSTTLPLATGEVVLLHRITRQIYGSFCVDVKDVRGIGLQITRLEHVDSSNKGNKNNALELWLSSYKKTGETGKELISSSNQDAHKPLHCKVDHDKGKSKLCVNENLFSDPSHVKLFNNAGPHENRNVTLPALCQLDIDVIENLPPEIFSEMNALYNGQLCDFMKNYNIRKGGETDVARSSKEIETASSSGSPKVGGDAEGNMTSAEAAQPFRDMRDKEKHPFCSPLLVLPVLPACVLPIHGERSQGATGNPPTDSLNKYSGSGSERVQKVEKSKVCLWLGNPPKWVEMFKVSNSLLLNVVAEMYAKAGTRCNLSSILQSLFSSCPLNFDLISEGWDEALASLCELIIEYIDLKVESDIEELYICFRLLKRFSSVSKLLLEVYNYVLPQLQVSVNELYGGHLQLSFVEHI